MSAVVQTDRVEDAPSSDVFASLNEAQRAAALHGAEPLAIIAGAGTGKTMTLAARVAHLVLAGVDPGRLMLLTFSRRAAAEMTQRAGRLLHRALNLAPTQRAPTLPWAGTFHAIGARLIRQYAAPLGLPPQFGLLDRGDAEDLMGLARQQLGLATQRERFPLKGTCLAIYSRCVNSTAPLDALLHDHWPWCERWRAELTRLFAAYVAEKQRQHLFDYDDLLLVWSQMMAEPALAAHLAARFDQVLVDEYQDTNRLQAAILHALRPDGRGLTVVGDDAQSIYAFRAAEVRNILDFPARFTPAARVVTLERNYRSTAPILDAANALIAQASEGFAKRLWTDQPGAQRPLLVSVDDELAQARWVADQVLAQREAGLKLRSQAVLFRTGTHSAALELELLRRQIPFVKFGGLKFLEAAHVKDALALLRWADNPRHRLAGFRVAQLVPGIAAASARRLLDAMDAAADPAQALQDFRAPPAAREGWAALAALMAALRSDAAWPADLQRCVQWYLPQLARLHDDAAPRRADLAQLLQLAAGHGSRERFLTELTLDPPAATSDIAGDPHLDEDYLILSTIHAAKGQEWSAVYLLNVVDGCMPADLGAGSQADIDEERRLLYVAMTRARQQLQLIVPQRFYVTQQAAYGDRHVYGGPSRFLTPEVTRCLDVVGAAGTAAAPVIDAPLAAIDTLPAIDIATRLRAAWD